MSKRFKAKLIAFVFIAAIGLVVGFFFSGLINFALTGLKMPGAVDTEESAVVEDNAIIEDDAPPSIAAALAPDAIMESLRENERHRLLFFGVEFIVICGSAVVLLMGRRETYESDTRMVTDAIQTPVAAGQGQHGTARWLKPAERGKVFTVFNLDPKETVFAALFDAGRKDVRGIDDYEETVE